ncbi:MAG: AAA family ATPase [Thermoguttaceae bacterium]|nr:AAA family ATPase [Thermoguttaceae bacterium]
MRITSFDIERFGVWEDLHLPKISRGLNLFYGPNEAGKTTLLQFLRSGLYGGGTEERARYIRMALGVTDGENGEIIRRDDSRPQPIVGGAMSVRTEFGEYRIDRRYLLRNTTVYDRRSALEARAGFVADTGLAEWSGRFYPIAGMGIAESLIVTGPDGARLSDYFVKTITGNVDEATFNNVFAIGLDELQKLGTLNETDAAQMLYRLSVGVDRVSLIQVLHQIVDERNEALDIDGGPSILEGLLAQRARLAEETQTPAHLLSDYVKTLEMRNVTQSEVDQLNAQLDRQRRTARLYELALGVADLWDQRADIKQQLSDAGVVLAVTDEALDEAGKKDRDCADAMAQIQSIKREYLAERKNYRAIRYSEPVYQNAARIELLGEGLPRMQTLAAEIALKRGDIARLQEDLQQEENRFKGVRQGIVSFRGRTDIPGVSAPADSADSEAMELPSDDFRVLARAMTSANKRGRQVQSLADEVQNRLTELTETLDRELSQRGQKNLGEALDNTNNQVKKLRRRVELGRRLNEFDRIRRELVAQNERLAATQSLPMIITLGIAAVVAVGVILAFLAFFSESRSVSPATGVIGLLAAAAAAIYKVTTERRNYASLVENQRQLSTVTRQIAETKEETNAIDAEIPAAGQTAETRLQKAEADLAVFERLLPTEAKWRETSHHAATLQKRLEHAQQSARKAKKHWVQWLRGAGLPETRDPPAVQALLDRVDIADALRRKLDTARGQLDLLLREQGTFSDQLSATYVSAQLTPTDDPSPEARHAGLASALDTVKSALARRAEVRRKLSGLRKRYRSALRLLRGRRRELYDFLQIVGAKSLDDLKDLSVRWKRHNDLVERLGTVQKRITALIDGFCEEEEIEPLLAVEDGSRAAIPDRQAEIRDRIAALESERARRDQTLGRLIEQLTGLESRREADKTRFDLASLNLRINRMASLWRTRAVAGKMMEEIRKSYEKERQPETLRDASRVLRRLTDGRYVKIWTPLGEDTLFVDTDDGRSLEVASLSRGLREQLFIAIRLALTGTFEKHGINLPMVFDDVLVNFDNRRARRAAKLLLEFAEAGRQIFLFTCHEHICRTFLELGIPVFVLPERSQKVKRFRVLLPESLQEIRSAAAGAPSSGEPLSLRQPSKSIPYIDSLRRKRDRGRKFLASPIVPSQKRVDPVTLLLRPAVSKTTDERPYYRPYVPSVGVPSAAATQRAAAQKTAKSEAPAAPVVKPAEPAVTQAEPPQIAPEEATRESVMERFLAPTAEEAQLDQTRRAPIEFSSWNDTFAEKKKEESAETAEPEEEEPAEDENTIARDDAFDSDSPGNIFKE